MKDIVTFDENKISGYAGEYYFGSIVFRQLKWIYRMQPIADIGIDGEIEILNKKQQPSGLIIKVQIKTTKQPDIHIYNRHKVYWSLLQIPVIIVRIDPENNSITFWDSEEFHSTPGGNFTYCEKNATSFVETSEVKSKLENIASRSRGKTNELTSNIDILKAIINLTNSVTSGMPALADYLSSHDSWPRNFCSDLVATTQKYVDTMSLILKLENDERALIKDLMNEANSILSRSIGSYYSQLNRSRAEDY